VTRDSNPASYSSVVSDDGTTVGFRHLGTGPGIVLVHGSMMTSHNFTKLAAALSVDFTAYVPDRRGRGASGPIGPAYGIERECEDLGAVLRATGARRVFGLSSGAIVALAAARSLPIDKLALYEPPLLVPGSAHTGWVPRYERELAAGKLASAMVTILKGAGDPSIFTSLPRFLLEALFRAAIRSEGKTEETGEPALKDLIPTMHFDAQLVAETEHALTSLANVKAQVLLLGGTKSARYLHRALDALEQVLPNVDRQELGGLGHLAADNGGKPLVMAEKLKAFFA
jgi:pimeloyl-ACP methyl ester carboxylesterase